MDKHIPFRLAILASLLVLIGLGATHPGNAELRPAMAFASFGALFMLGTVGLGLYFEAGPKVFGHAKDFLLHSEIAALMSGIFVLALGGIGFISWAEMNLAQQVPFVAAILVGAASALREHLSGIAPEGQPL